MKRIEYQELKLIGLSESALDVYNNTDPLTVYKRIDGLYTIDGVIEEDKITMERLESLLLSLLNLEEG